jgi:hypothetical protein
MIFLNRGCSWNSNSEWYYISLPAVILIFFYFSDLVKALDYSRPYNYWSGNYMSSVRFELPSSTVILLHINLLFLDFPSPLDTPSILPSCCMEPTSECWLTSAVIPLPRQHQPTARNFLLLSIHCGCFLLISAAAFCRGFSRLVSSYWWQSSGSWNSQKKSWVDYFSSNMLNNFIN